MKKYDFSDKKLKRDNLKSAIWLTVICISPILYAIVEYHSDIFLMECILTTAFAVFVVSFLWAFFFVFDFRDIKQADVNADSDCSNKEKKRMSLGFMLFVSLLAAIPIVVVVVVHHSDSFLIKYIVMTSIVTTIISFSWAFYFAMKDWDTDAGFDDSSEM